MNKYDVHIYAVTRVKVAGVEAARQKQAIVKAEKKVDLHSVLDGGAFGLNIESIEYAEEIVGFMVDEVGDEFYTKSNQYDGDGELKYTNVPLPRFVVPSSNVNKELLDALKKANRYLILVAGENEDPGAAYLSLEIEETIAKVEKK